MYYYPKQCPKCGGDLAQCSDQFGRYVSCMSCEWYQNVEEPQNRTSFLVLYHKSCKGVMDTRDDRNWFCTCCGEHGTFTETGEEVIVVVYGPSFLDKLPA